MKYRHSAKIERSW